MWQVCCLCCFESHQPRVRRPHQNHPPSRRVQALVLSPTRELAQQTEKLVLAIGDFMNIQAHACVGGHSVGERPLAAAFARALCAAQHG